MRSNHHSLASAQLATLAPAPAGHQWHIRKIPGLRIWIAHTATIGMIGLSSN